MTFPSAYSCFFFLKFQFEGCKLAPNDTWNYFPPSNLKCYMPQSFGVCPDFSYPLLFYFGSPRSSNPFYFPLTQTYIRSVLVRYTWGWNVIRKSIKVLTVIDAMNSHKSWLKNWRVMYTECPQLSMPKIFYLPKLKHSRPTKENKNRKRAYNLCQQRYSFNSLSFEEGVRWEITSHPWVINTRKRKQR